MSQAASAGDAALAPKPAVGARIVIQPTLAIAIGDDPDAQRAHMARCKLRWWQ